MKTATFSSYLLGFLLSLLLTLAAYLLAVRTLLSGWPLDLALTLLALTQGVVQLLFFLNLAHESKPRWNLLVFLFTLMVTLILVFGSIWIMNNLDYNLMGK